MRREICFLKSNLRKLKIQTASSMNRKRIFFQEIKNGTESRFRQCEAWINNLHSKLSQKFAQAKIPKDEKKSHDPQTSATPSLTARKYHLSNGINRILFHDLDNAKHDLVCYSENTASNEKLHFELQSPWKIAFCRVIKAIVLNYFRVS